MFRKLRVIWFLMIIHALLFTIARTGIKNFHCVEVGDGKTLSSLGWKGKTKLEPLPF